MAEPSGSRVRRHSVQLFGSPIRNDLAAGSGAILSLQDGQPAVVVCAMELPEPQERLAAQLIQALGLAREAWYNRTNCMQLLILAVDIHTAVLASSTLRDDTQLASKLLHLAWEMCYFFSFFSYSGWLRRLLKDPPDDNATFESLRQSLLKLAPGGAAERRGDSWTDGAAHIRAQLQGTGGVQYLCDCREFATMTKSPTPPYSSSGFEAPEGMASSHWDNAVDQEVAMWVTNQALGPHMQLRHKSLRVMWHLQLQDEEVSWAAFWAAIATLGDYPEVQKLGASETHRQLVEAQLHKFAPAGMVNVLEVDMAFPPLDSLPASFSRLLRCAGTSSQDIKALFTSQRSTADGAAGRTSMELASGPGASHSAGAAEELAGSCRSEPERSGMLVLVAGPGEGKSVVAAMATEQLLRSRHWHSVCRVDLHTANTAAEAADLIATGLLADPYCMASEGPRRSGKQRLKHWLRMSSAGFHASPETRVGSELEVHRVGIVLTHVNMQLLQDEIEADALVELICFILDQASSTADLPKLMTRTRRTHVQIILTAQTELDIGESSSGSWFLRTHRLSASLERGAAILRDRMHGAVRAAVGDRLPALASALESNPLALQMLSTALNSGAITPDQAAAVLKRRIPPTMAMKLQKSGDSGLPVAPTGVATKTGPTVADPVRSVRGGRKSVLDARQTLKSAVAKAVISLLAYTPTRIKDAVMVLSFLPSFEFDMPTALHMLASSNGARLSSTAGALFCMLECGLLKYDRSSGAFSLQPSVYRVVRALIVVSEISARLTELFTTAVSSMLEICGRSLTHSAVAIQHGAPVSGLYMLNRNMPLSWMVQYWSQERILDQSCAAWLASYLYPMVQHPTMFAEHMPSSLRVTLCRTMAATAGFVGTPIGRSITLWHLGRSLYDDGQVLPAHEVLERAAEALDAARQDKRPDRSAPSMAAHSSLAMSLLEAQLHCARAVCLVAMNKSEAAEAAIAVAVKVQTKVLSRIDAQADVRPGNSGRGSAQGGSASGSARVRERRQSLALGRPDLTLCRLSATIQLTAAHILAGCLELRRSNNSEALGHFDEAVAKSAELELQCLDVSVAATAYHGQAAALALCGRWEEAEAAMFSAVRQWEAGGPMGQRAVSALGDYAQLLHGLGKADKAQVVMERVLEHTDGSRSLDYKEIEQLRGILGEQGPRGAEPGVTELPARRRSRNGRKKLFSAFKSAFGIGEKDLPADPDQASKDRAALTDLSRRWATAPFAEIRWGWMGVQGWDAAIWYGSALLAGVSSRDYEPQLMRSVSACRPSKAAALVAPPSTLAGDEYAGLTFSERAIQLSTHCVDPESPSKANAPAENGQSLGQSPNADTAEEAADTGDSSPEQKAPPARRRRPAARAASGSLAYSQDLTAPKPAVAPKLNDSLDE